MIGAPQSTTVTPSISGVSPNPVTGSNSAQPFTINGSNFQSGCTVTLRDLTAGQTFINRPIQSQTSTQIVINPNFTTAADSWSVEVINPGNASSGQYHFSVVTPRLLAPTLGTPANGATSVTTSPTFTWSQVSGNTGYRIIVSTNQADLTTDPASTGGTSSGAAVYLNLAANATSYTYPYSLASGTTYSWEVHALGTSTANNGYWSQASFTTAAAVTPLPPPTLTAPANGATGQSTSPTFTWSQVSGNTGYRIIVSTSQADLTTDPTSSGGTSSNAAVYLNLAANTTSYTYPNTLASGTTYYWEVHALGTSTANNGYWSQASFTTAAAVTPLPPPTLTAPANGATSVTTSPTFTWSQVSGNTGYRIIVSTNQADLTTDPASTGGTSSGAAVYLNLAANTTSYTYPYTLASGTTYYWEVHALGTSIANNGYWSQAGFTTLTASLPDVPSNPTPADNSTPATQPTLFDWADAANATSYDVYLNGTFAANVTASQWTPQVNFAPGIQQSWYVVAKNASGSTQGPTWHFTVGGSQGGSVVAGFDREFFPAHADTMADLINRTNLRWCGYYLSGPSQRLYTGWLGERSYLEGLGWKLAPIYVGQQDAGYNGGNLSYSPSAQQGTIDGNEAVAEMGPDTGSMQTVYQYDSSSGKYDIPKSVPIGQGFSTGTVVFLDWESGTLTIGNDTDYVVNWCKAVAAGGYVPGVYCHPSEVSTVSSQLNAYGVTAQFWVANWANQPAVPSTTTQFATTDPTAGGSGATSWQYGSGYSIDTVNGLLPNVDLDTSSLFGNSTGTLPTIPSSPTPADNSTPATQPTLFDWADSANATSYDVYLNGAFAGNVTASQWTPQVNFAPGIQQNWYVVAKNASGSTQGPTWHFTVGASQNKPNLVPGSVTLTSSSVNAGGSLGVNWRMNNTGTADAVATPTGIRIGTSNTTHPPSSGIPNVATGAIAAGSYLDQSTTITIPAGTAPGTYYVWVIADNAVPATLDQTNTADDWAVSGSFTVASGVTAAPTLTSSQAGDGSAQRSSLASLTLVFSAPVTLTASSFALECSHDGATWTDVSGGVGVNNPSGDGTTWVLSCVAGGTLDRTTGSATPRGLLADGVYRLTLHGAAIGVPAGAAPFGGGSDQRVSFASNISGSGGQAGAFHVLYGDVNGDATVNNTDYFQFKKAYATSVGDPAFQASFDYNGDGMVNNTDYFQFKNRYGKTSVYPSSAAPASTLSSSVTAQTSPVAAGAFATAPLATTAIMERPTDGFAVPNWAQQVLRGRKRGQRDSVLTP